MYGFLIIMFLLMPLFMLVLLLALVSNFVMVSMVNEERHEMREGEGKKQCKESL